MWVKPWLTERETELLSPKLQELRLQDNNNDSNEFISCQLKIQNSYKLIKIDKSIVI